MSDLEFLLGANTAQAKKKREYRKEEAHKMISRAWTLHLCDGSRSMKISKNERIMKNKWIIILVAAGAVFTGCNGNANGSVESKSDTSVDTIGKHSPYGIDTLVRKRMDSVINKNDSLH